MSPPVQLASAAAAAQAAAPQQAQQASEQCSQLWTQLQGLMQQREKEVSAREQQAAQYGQVEELLAALARHVQALLGDQQNPPHQLQETPPAPTDNHAAALQVVRQLLQQASAVAGPATDPQPLLPAQQQGQPMHLTPAVRGSSPRSSTACMAGLQDPPLQETVLAMQHAGEGLGPAGQQGPAQPQHMSHVPGQQRQQQQAAADLHALSQDMHSQLAHLQQLQASLDAELQQAHLFAQYLAADSAAAAAFRAWQDSRQQAPPALAAGLLPSPPQQQAQAGQGTTQEQRHSSPVPSAAVHSRAASPQPLTATQAAAYRLGRSRSRSRTPQLEQPQQQGHAAVQDLGAVFPSPVAGAAATVGAAKRVRPWVDSNGSASAGHPGAAGSSSKRQRTDLLLPPEPAKPHGAGSAGGEPAAAAAAAAEAGSSPVDAATRGPASPSARGRPAPPLATGDSPAAAAAGPKPHLFRPTIPDRVKRPGPVLSPEIISADAAAAVLGDRGALPAGRPGKQLWTQQRFGGRRTAGRGDKSAPVSPAGYQQQQPWQGQAWGQSPRQLQPQQQQQLQEQAQGHSQHQQQGDDEELDLDNLYHQAEQGQQGHGQLVDYSAGAGQLLAVVCQGDREGDQLTGAAAVKPEPPETLYAAADGRIFYSQQPPQQLPLEGPRRGRNRKQRQRRDQQQQHHQHQQQPQDNEQQQEQQQQQPHLGVQSKLAKRKARKQKQEARPILAADEEGQRQAAAAADTRQAVAEAAGRSPQPSAAAAAPAAAAGGGVSNGHTPDVAAAGGVGRQLDLHGGSSALHHFAGRRPPHHPPHPAQHYQQQRQGQPLPYHHHHHQQQQQPPHQQHHLPHHLHQHQQQHRGMPGLGGSKPRIRPRLGGGCGWGQIDEQDASLQDLQQQVAELAQQAAAVTAGGSDATATVGSS